MLIARARPYRLWQRIAWLVIVAALAACRTDDIIQVVPDLDRARIEPTATIQSITALPKVRGPQLPTLAPTPTPRVEAPAGEFGPIVAPGYVQPPTTTPRATAIPASQPASRAMTTPLPRAATWLDPSLMGIQTHYDFGVVGWERTLRQIAPLRLGWIKLQAAWEWLQPDRPGQFDQNFRLFQLHVQAADKHGYKVLLSVAKAPDWARPGNRQEDGPPDNLEELRAFIQLLLEKLGPHIDAIEIWNEPNLRREWSGSRPLNGASYMELFRVAYEAVRAHAPHIQVITAGLAPTGNLAGVSVNDREFLRQMIRAGLAGYSDIAIGVHPYGWGNPPDFVCCDNVAGQGWDDYPQFFFRQTLDDTASILAAAGMRTPMWVTEFGWATWEGYPNDAPDRWMAYNSERDQRDYALRAFEIGQARADIGVMILWNLSFANETTVNQRSELAAYSILYPAFDGSGSVRRRPLYDALERRA